MTPRAAAALVPVAVLGAFATAFGATFQFDDAHTVVDNPEAHSWSAWAASLPAIRALTKASFVASRMLADAPWSFVLTSVVLHALAAAGAVLVQLRAGQHDGADLHVAVRVQREPPATGDDIVREAGELTEVGLARYEGIPRPFPAVVAVHAVSGGAMEQAHGDQAFNLNKGSISCLRSASNHRPSTLRSTSVYSPEATIPGAFAASMM